MARGRSTLARRIISVDDLEVQVIEKPRLKNWHLRVQPDGRVQISVPPRTPDSSIRDFVRTKRPWIRKVRSELEDSPMARAALADDDELAQWRAVVEARVPALVEQWEAILGVKAGKLVYRKMKSRWGSCQPTTGRICINTVLALYPPECLEYVVVHELVHLLVAGHGPEFYEIMDRVMPDWKQRRAILSAR